MIPKTNLIIIFSILLFSKITFSQTTKAPYLGSLYHFALYTEVGAIASTGTSRITGNMGTGTGAISNFDIPGTLDGIIYVNNAATDLAAQDLESAHQQLTNTIPTNTVHAPVFGDGETLTPGVYAIGGAGSTSDTLILDALNDTNAVFIFKIWGAFTTAASSKIILLNKASASNVFWIAEGAIAMAASTEMQGTLIAHNGAASMGASCTLNGRMFSTRGALSVYTSTISLPLGDFNTTWTGNAKNTDWFNVLNWSKNIPTIYDAAIIPASLPDGNLYPLISNAATVGSLSIAGSGMITVENSTLQIKGSLVNGGLIDATNGTIDMIGKVPQSIPANAFVGNTVNNLIISNNVTLDGPLNITCKLSFSGDNQTLNAGSNLTLKSTEMCTAQLSDLTNNGKNSGNSIIGAVNIERFVAAKRAWWLLTSPITSNNAPTIRSAWQEGGEKCTGDALHGCGTQITGGAADNGFDKGVNSNPSLKIFANNNLIGLPLFPGTNIAISTYPGYFIFIRGDRTTNLQQGVKAVPTNTTMRIKGELNMGNVTKNINAEGLTLVGNPYPSAINFNTLSKTNVNDKFYVWDPKLGGTNGLGGYVTISGNGTSYDVSPAESSSNQFIQSGAAFFIESADGKTPGTLTFKESDKNIPLQNTTQRVAITQAKLNVDLMGINKDNSSYIIDGTLATYDDINDNKVNRFDAKKMFNQAEVIAIGKDNNLLAIERRHTIENNDTTVLSLFRLEQQQYSLHISTTGMSKDLSAFIKDNYSATTNNTPLNLNGGTNINFTVNNDSASFAVNRFSIVFERKIPTIISVNNVKAFVQHKDIIVEWKNLSEDNVSSYQVQTDNSIINTTNNFKTVATVPAKANNSSAVNYSWADAAATVGTHTYRIKAVSFNGNVNYSSIVQATIFKTETNLPAIAVFGNMIQSNTITYKLSNVKQGAYVVMLYTMQGQLVNMVNVSHDGGPASLHSFTAGANFIAGKYILTIKGQSVNEKTSFIKE